MNLPRIVCPYNRDLLHSFRERAVAVRVAHPDQAPEAAAQVQESGNSLFCVIIDTALPLGDLELKEAHQEIPLAVMAPCLGKFRHLAGRLELWRDLNLRVYLSCDRPENLVGLRILSSLGIHSAAVFAPGRPKDWQALADLMTYAVLERVPHAPMEPFAFIASRYDPFAYLEWGALNFDDPRHFLHLDGQGRVALSAAELGEGRFIAASLGVPEDFPAIRARAQAWRRFFLDNHPCASCGGWKICLGKFAADLPKNPGCVEFFLEMLEVARQYKERQAPAAEGGIWQP